MENNQQPVDRTKTTLLRRRDTETLTDYVLRFLQAYPVKRGPEQSFYRPKERVRPGTKFEKFTGTR